MEHVLCPLFDHARQRPHQQALITEKHTWTYLEADNQVNSLCMFLKETGVQENHRVAFLSPTTPDTIFLFFALFRLGAIACPLSTRLPQKQVLKNLEQLNPSHFLDTTGLPKNFTSLNPTEHLPKISLHKSATFLFTSGSSGKPKIACHSFANHYYNAIGVISLLKLTTSSTWLLSLPLFHVSGIAILFRSFLQGSAVVLSNSPLSEAMIHHNISHLSCVPTQLIRLLQEKEEILKQIKHPLQCILLGGAPICPTLLQAAMDEGIPLFSTYGMTEMSSIITLSNGGSVLSFREIMIAKDWEIHVRGETLFQGYWDQKLIKQDAQKWFATKDLGRFNPQGELEIFGRKDRQFISGGENIQPEEIEQALCSIKGILNAIVLPIDDPQFGQRPVAFIDDETKSHTLESIRQELKDKLPSFKHPTALIFHSFEVGSKPNLFLLKDQLRLQNIP